MTMENKPLLQVKDLTVTFGERHNKFTAVKNVSFDIFQGETFGLVGESGSGKTTIGRTVIRINPAASGEILYDGERISGRISREKDREVTRKIQMIFQDPMASLNERAKVDYIVSEGLYNLGGRVSEEERRKKVAQALSDVGLLPEFASRFPHEFSGGQRQRIGIARALIMEPEFIIADEPISALDVSIRAQVLNLMAELQRRRGLTYLLISHDLSVMHFICDRIAVIHLGRIVELSSTEKLFAHPPFMRIRCIRIRERCFPLFRCRTLRRKNARSWRCTTRPAIIMRQTLRHGRRSNRDILCLQIRKNLKNTGQ